MTVPLSDTSRIAAMIENAFNGSVTISIDPRMKDSHIAYRANWNLQDAGDKVLSQSNIDAMLDNYASEGKIDWDNGGHFLQEIARQIKTEYVRQVLADEKTGEKYKDMESRLIRIEEDHQ